MAQPFALIGKVMEKRAANVVAGAAKVARAVATRIGEEVVYDTPVDTGTARSNWIMTIDEIATYTIPAYVPYPKTHHDIYEHRAGQKAAGYVHALGTGDKEETANASAALAQHAAAIEQYDALFNHTIYIANNVIYMGRLNEGYSPQTEAGFVMRAVEVGVAAAARISLLEGR